MVGIAMDEPVLALSQVALEIEAIALMPKLDLDILRGAKGSLRNCLTIPRHDP